MENNHMKSLLAVLCVIVLMSGIASAQNDSYLINRQPSLSVMPNYQNWSVADAFKFSESNVAVSLYVPAGKEWSFTLSSLPASLTGDLNHLNGYTDTQIGMVYHVESPDVVVTLDMNLPTGKKELTQEEFETSMIISNSVFNLRAPNFGQGLNLYPGVLWAIPLNEDLVLGLGAAYQYRGSYKPLANYDEYDPGDEIIATGGVDFRLAEATTLSADLVFTSYGTDKLGGVEVFSPGSKFLTNLQFTKSLGANELRLFTQYVAKSKGSIAVGTAMVDEVGKAEPNRFAIQGQFAVHMNEKLNTTFVVEGRFYEDSALKLAGRNLYGLGLEPTIILSQTMTIPVRFKYQSGEFQDGQKFSGVALGVGLNIIF